MSDTCTTMSDTCTTAAWSPTRRRYSTYVAAIELRLEEKKDAQALGQLVVHRFESVRYAVRFGQNKLGRAELVSAVSGCTSLAASLAVCVRQRTCLDIPLVLIPGNGGNQRGFVVFGACALQGDCGVRSICNEHQVAAPSHALSCTWRGRFSHSYWRQYSYT